MTFVTGFKFRAVPSTKMGGSWHGQFKIDGEDHWRVVVNGSKLPLEYTSRAHAETAASYTGGLAVVRGRKK